MNFFSKNDWWWAESGISLADVGKESSEPLEKGERNDDDPDNSMNINNIAISINSNANSCIRN